MPKLFDNTLMTVSPLALIEIWGELVEAYHGVNKFGGDTAEIYAYILTRYSPMVHTLRSQGRYGKEVAVEVAIQAANALCAIIDEFCTKYECEAELDGVSLEGWCTKMNHCAGIGEVTFDHRVHVRITKKVDK